MSDRDVRRILLATVEEARAATDLFEELGIPLRTVYRHLEELKKLGLVTGERSALLDGGGKYVLYRSMVKSITVRYEGDMPEVDLVPNEGILGRFMRFWSYMGR